MAADCSTGRVFIIAFVDGRKITSTNLVAWVLIQVFESCLPLSNVSFKFQLSVTP